MIKINFFECDRLLKGLSQLYNIEEPKIISTVAASGIKEDRLEYFLKQTSIKLDMVDINDVVLHCKHVMTTDDNFESLRRYGLITLDKVMKLNTPLHEFLQVHGIEVDVENRIINYKSKKAYLYEVDEECTICFYGEGCKYLIYLNGEKTNLTYRNMACDYREGISNLRTKLYSDKSEIEVHLAGEEEDVKDYSVVKYYPEILLTIEELIWKLFGENPHLTDDWRKKQNNRYFCLDFDVSIFKFERITSMSIFSNDYDYYEYNEKPLDNRTSKNFYGNLFILDNAIRVLSAEKPTLYGQLLPSVNIPFKDITISEYKIL